MAANLTSQVRSIAKVTTAVAAGNLSTFIEVDAQGEILQLKNTVNNMVAQLFTLANEVTRVSLEVGTKGILGGQAKVTNVEGMWKVLTDNVSLLFSCFSFFRFRRQCLIVVVLNLRHFYIGQPNGKQVVFLGQILSRGLN